MDEDKSEEQYKPWLEVDEWQNGHIHSADILGFYIFLLFVLFWCAISFPAAYLAITDTYSDGRIDRFEPILLILIFPILGIVMSYWLVSAYRQWSIFGALSMVLDPYPGSIGGEVGGYVEIPVSWSPEYNIEVILNNIYYTNSRTTNDSADSEEVVWQKHCALNYVPAASGSRILFKCAVDGGEPSEKRSKTSYYRWVVNIRVTNEHSSIKLDRDFDIPVFRFEPPLVSTLHLNAQLPEMGVDRIDDRQVIVTQHARSVELFFPKSRLRPTAKVLFFMAGLFLLITAILGYETLIDFARLTSGFSYLSIGIMGFVTIAFALVSIALMLVALHYFSNEIQTSIDSHGITSSSTSWLRHWEKSAAANEIDKITKITHMSSGRGSQSVIFYTLAAQLKDKPAMEFGNGIKGQLAADALIRLVNKQLELKNE